MNFKIGDEVLAPWANDGFVYPAVLVALEGERAHVAYLDGDEADAAASALRHGAFGPGLSVSVNWKGQRKYYRGTIVKRAGMAVEINYDDGTRGWATIAQCRVLAEIVAVLAPEEVACTFCGARISVAAVHCANCGAARPGR